MKRNEIVSLCVSNISCTAVEPQETHILYSVVDRREWTEPREMVSSLCCCSPISYSCLSLTHSNAQWTHFSPQTMDTVQHAGKDTDQATEGEVISVHRL